MFIDPHHIISVKGTIGQLEVGDDVFLNDSSCSAGTVHDSIRINATERDTYTIVPNADFRFVLRPPEPPEHRGGAPTYTFLQFHKKHPCFIRVRADQIAGLIAPKDEDDL